MASAVRLRKALLAVLQDKVLPALSWQSTVQLALAQLPLRAPADFNVRALARPPLEEADATRIYPEGNHWAELELHSIKFPALFCVVEGEIDLPMGVTTSMLGRLRPGDLPEPLCGGYIISLAAPAYLLFPPGVPQRTGVYPPWWRDTPHTGFSSFLSVRVLPVGALCHLTTMRDGRCKNDYSLLVKDNQLAPAMGLLMDELSTPAPDAQIIQAQLLTLMLRLKRRLEAEIPLMTDGLYSRFPDSDPSGLPVHSRHTPVVERAHEYIQMHLHEPLNPAAIAAQVRLTPTQLNRIFKARAGLSTMGYVAQLRMEAAQLLLRTSDLSVQEICRLVGYRQLPHFSRTFRRHTGSSPLQFRRRQDDR
jgi:AraC-like DNA-binding protein